MILTENKITNQDYVCNRLVYVVVCLLMITTAAGDTQWGVCLVVRDQLQVWSVESTRFHRPNVVSCEVITDRKRTPIFGKDLPPSTLQNLQYLEEALPHFRDKYPIVKGDLSADISKSQNPRSHKVADLLMRFELMELILHVVSSGVNPT